MDKLKLEEVASKAVELIRSDRQNLWKVKDLNSNRQYLNAVKSSKIDIILIVLNDMIHYMDLKYIFEIQLFNPVS